MNLDFIGTHKYSLVNAVKTVIAVTLAYIVGVVLGNYFQVQRMYLWMVVTVIVVMSTQPNLGGAINKALMRFIGTIASSFIAILIIAICDNQHEVLVLGIVFIGVGVFIAGASSKYSYAGTLAGITMAIIILNQDVNIQTAIYRTIEIVQGIVIALLVNRFILPIKAEKRLQESFATTVKNIRKFHLILYQHRGKDHEKILTTIFASFTKQMSLMSEASYEVNAVKIKLYNKMGLYIRRVYRYMIVVYEYIYLQMSSTDKDALLKEDIFIEIKEQIERTLYILVGDLMDNRDIDCYAILRLEKDIIAKFENIGCISDNHRKLLGFFIKSFFNSLKHLAIEHNHILNYSKH